LGALIERVHDGVDGLLLPPGNAAAWQAGLQMLINEPRLLDDLRANVAAPTTLAEHVNRMESLYSRAVYDL
jgi:hypothetical protein